MNTGGPNANFKKHNIALYMDLKREKILIEGGLRSACHKSGRIFIQGEFVTCEKFRELFASCVKLPDIDINCPSMMYIEECYGNDRRFAFLIDMFTGSIHSYRCSFNITIPRGKHSGSGCIVTDVCVEKWEYGLSINYKPDYFESEEESDSRND